MFDILFNYMGDWIRGLLIEGISTYMAATFLTTGDVLDKYGSSGLLTLNGDGMGISSLIQTLSQNVILPIAGIILTFVMCYELIQIIIQKNNLHDVDTWIFFKWIFKTFITVLLVTNTWQIVTAVFNLGNRIVQQASGTISSAVGLDSSAVMAGLINGLQDKTVGELIGLFITSTFVFITISMNIKDIDLTEETKGCFDFGNAVFSYSGESGIDWLRIQVCVSGNNTEQDYFIGRITPEERFADEVVFDYHDDALFWNRGQRFIGKADAAIKLRLETEADRWEYPLDLEDNLVIDKPDLPIDEYHYQIVKESENIFLGDETVLCQGTLLIGDKNELRFRNHMIEITNITYEEEGDPFSVEIRNTYIDHIEYQGIQYVNSEDRECPVYTGEMFYMGQSKKHHYFSFEEKEGEKGILLYNVNPVRIVYINEHTLSITNQDGDGIYYYRFFDKNAMANHYAITDREPVSRNQSNYHLADLYTYRKERNI